MDGQQSTGDRASCGESAAYDGIDDCRQADDHGATWDDFPVGCPAGVVGAVPAQDVLGHPAGDHRAMPDPIHQRAEALRPFVCPVAFGQPGSDALALWLRAYRLSGSALPVCVISDGEPMDTHGLPVAHFAGMWPAGSTSTGMRKAGAIKIAARRLLRETLGYDGPVIAIDTDIIQQRPIDGLVDVCTGSEMAIGPNAWETRYSWLPELRDEKNTGLIWLDSDEPERQWNAVWPSLYESVQEIREIPYSDEIVQSLIWQRLNGPELDRTWNLSHRLTGEYATAMAVHFHGPNKTAMAAHVLALEAQACA
jgi:hypothetical protein